MLKNLLLLIQIYLYFLHYREENSLITEKAPSSTIVKIESKPLVALPKTESQSNKNERGKPMRQVIASLIANIGTINVGFAFGFSAVAIPQLMAPDSVLKVDESQASWIGK